jgi:hypothetical protein
MGTTACGAKGVKVPKVKPQVLVLGYLLVAWLLFLLLWEESLPAVLQPFVGYLYLGTCLIAFPLLLRHILETIGRAAIETGTHHGRGFVLRGQTAIKMGRRLILFGRCFALFCLGVAWIGLVYQWFRTP